MNAGRVYRSVMIAELWNTIAFGNGTRSSDAPAVGQTVTLAPEWYPIGGRVYLGMDPGSRLR